MAHLIIDNHPPRAPNVRQKGEPAAGIRAAGLKLRVRFRRRINRDLTKSRGLSSPEARGHQYRLASHPWQHRQIMGMRRGGQHQRDQRSSQRLSNRAGFACRTNVTAVAVNAPSTTATARYTAAIAAKPLPYPAA